MRRSSRQAKAGKRHWGAAKSCRPARLIASPPGCSPFDTAAAPALAVRGAPSCCNGCSAAQTGDGPREAPHDEGSQT